MADYIIVATLLLAFFLKQVINYYDDKLKNANDSYIEAKALDKLGTLNFIFNITVLILILAIIYWVYYLKI